MRSLIKKLVSPLIWLMVAAPAMCDQIPSFQFKGLNNNENSVIIDPANAQDLLNIDVTPGGKSIKKRSGYGLYKAMATGQAIHGGYHFYDASGNDIQVWGSSTSLYGIVADATQTQLISSATLSTTWDCSDAQGSAYCVNSSRNAFVKTNGATMTWYASPLGTMVETTPDRVVVAGVSGNTNTLYFSEANVFTNFVTALNPSSPFQEVIAAPGSKITHIKWGCGKLLWWKDQSMGTLDFDDQFNLQVKTVSDTIGTFDNTSAIDPGGSVWFRGQDGHIYRYDCSFITKESVDITPDVDNAGHRIANSWTQTTASDFNSGSSAPSTNVSTGTSSGDVVFNGVISTETSSAKWSLGTASNLTVGSSSITLTLNNSGNVTNNDFELGSTGVVPSTWTSVGSGWIQTATAYGSECSPFTGYSGANFAQTPTGQKGSASPIVLALVIDPVTETTLDIKSYAIVAVNCAFASKTLPITSSNIGKRVKLRFTATDNDSGTSDYDLTTTGSFILGGDISFTLAVSGNGAGLRLPAIDQVLGGSSTITTGSFTSQTFDLGFSSSTVQLSTFSWTSNTSTPTFSIVTATASTGPWYTLTSSSNTWALGNRYVRYVTTITIGSSDNALTAITAAVLTRSTGTYYSAVHNAPSLTSWDTVTATRQDNDGTHTFYTRSSTNSFTTLSSTPTWVVQTAGAAVSASTGTFFQLRDDFAITYSTQTPTLNDFTVNWFEGNSTDQAYMLYFDNAIWESVAFGAGQSLNNYIFKRDLINDIWTLYGFGANGMTIQNNNLYFGDPSAGNLFIYGSGTSDNGTAINAFWKSKDFVGTDPFLQSQLLNIDVFAKKDQGTTLTATYTLDTSTATSYSISLSTSTSIIQNRKNLPNGKLGYAFNFKIGDTSQLSSWEVFGWRFSFAQLPYRVSQ